MGCDKSRLRLGRRTLLGHVRALAASAGLRVRVIRRDLVDRCGPLGGIYSALKTSDATAEVFLACDMPFVSMLTVRRLLRRVGAGAEAIFVERDGVVGFPFVIPVAAQSKVEEQIRAKSHSLQQLAASLRAQRVSLPSGKLHELLNVNTPDDWRRAREIWEDVRSRK
jgi:molybdenum cofactor guanylyltransferase